MSEQADDLAFVKERAVYWDTNLREMLQATPHVDYLLSVCVALLSNKDAVIRHQDDLIQQERDLRGRVQAECADIEARAARGSSDRGN